MRTNLETLIPDFEPLAREIDPDQVHDLADDDDLIEEISLEAPSAPDPIEAEEIALFKPKVKDLSEEMTPPEIDHLRSDTNDEDQQESWCFKDDLQKPPRPKQETEEKNSALAEDGSHESHPGHEIKPKTAPRTKKLDEDDTEINTESEFDIEGEFDHESRIQAKGDMEVDSQIKPKIIPPQDHLFLQMYLRTFNFLQLDREKYLRYFYFFLHRYYPSLLSLRDLSPKALYHILRLLHELLPLSLYHPVADLFRDYRRFLQIQHHNQQLRTQKHNRPPRFIVYQPPISDEEWDALQKPAISTHQPLQSFIDPFAAYKTSMQQSRSPSLITPPLTQVVAATSSSNPSSNPPPKNTAASASKSNKGKNSPSDSDVGTNKKPKTAIRRRSILNFYLNDESLNNLEYFPKNLSKYLHLLDAGAKCNFADDELNTLHCSDFKLNNLKFLRTAYKILYNDLIDHKILTDFVRKGTTCLKISEKSEILSPITMNHDTQAQESLSDIIQMILSITEKSYNEFTIEKLKKPSLPSDFHHNIVENNLAQLLNKYIICSEPLVAAPQIPVAGHIDLVGYRSHVDDDGTKKFIVSILDFKPTNSLAGITSEFIRTFPQLMSYAFLIENIINNNVEFSDIFSNFDDLAIDLSQSPKDIEVQIECITFNKDRAWVFDPHEMLDHIAQMKDLVNENHATYQNYLADSAVIHYFQNSIAADPSNTSLKKDYEMARNPLNKYPWFSLMRYTQTFSLGPDDVVEIDPSIIKDEILGFRANKHITNIKKILCRLNIDFILALEKDHISPTWKNTMSQQIFLSKPEILHLVANHIENWKTLSNDQIAVLKTRGFLTKQDLSRGSIGKLKPYIEYTLQDFQKRMNRLFSTLLNPSHEIAKNFSISDSIINEIMDLSEGGDPDNPNLFIRTDLTIGEKISRFFMLFLKIKLPTIWSSFRSESSRIFAQLHKYITNCNRSDIANVSARGIFFHNGTPYRLGTKEYNRQRVKVVEDGLDHFSVYLLSEPDKKIWDSDDHMLRSKGIYVVTKRGNLKYKNTVRYIRAKEYIGQKVLVIENPHNPDHITVHRTDIQKKSNETQAEFSSRSKIFDSTEEKITQYTVFSRGRIKYKNKEWPIGAEIGTKVILEDLGKDQIRVRRADNNKVVYDSTITIPPDPEIYHVSAADKNGKGGGQLKFHGKRYTIGIKYRGEIVRVKSHSDDCFEVFLESTGNKIYDSIDDKKIPNTALVKGKKSNKNIRLVHYMGKSVSISTDIPVGTLVKVNPISKTDFTIHDVKTNQLLRDSSKPKKTCWTISKDGVLHYKKNISIPKGRQFAGRKVKIYEYSDGEVRISDWKNQTDVIWDQKQKIDPQMKKREKNKSNLRSVNSNMFRYDGKKFYVGRKYNGKKILVEVDPFNEKHITVYSTIKNHESGSKKFRKNIKIKEIHL